MDTLSSDSLPVSQTAATRRLRGLVVSARPDSRGHASFTAELDASDLRHYLLYWDRLDWPLFEDIERPEYREAARAPALRGWYEELGVRPPSAEEDFLVQEGILHRSRVSSQRSYVGDELRQSGELVFMQEHFKVLHARNSTEPGLWSVTKTFREFSDSSDSLASLRIVEVQLYQALPSPPPTASLQDILWFKERRQPELIALRAALDELYESVISSKDIERARVAAFDRLERAIQQLDRAVTESWPTRLRRSMKVELRPVDTIMKATLGVALFAKLNLSPIAGGVLTALANTIKFEAKVVRGPVPPDDLKDFAYVLHARRELGWS